MSRATKRRRSARAAIVAVAGACLALGDRPALAHGPGSTSLDGLLGSWSLDPFTVASLGVGGLLYWRGLEVVWRRAGTGGGVQRRQAAAFAAGLAVVVLALISPLEHLSEELFSAHMAQHMLLTLAAAPLLALGAPWVAMLWAFPARARRGIGGVARWRAVRAVRAALLSPLPIAAIHAGLLVFWHLPTPYGWALGNDWVHLGQHATFLVPAFFFWVAVLPHGTRRHAYPRSIVALFAVAGAGAGLGALLTVSPEPWYAGYGDLPEAWGLSPLEDQQLGGSIMWVPGGLVYGGAAVYLAARWLRGLEQQSPGRLRPGVPHEELAPPKGR